MVYLLMFFGFWVLVIVIQVINPQKYILFPTGLRYGAHLRFSLRVLEGGHGPKDFAGASGLVKIGCMEWIRLGEES